MFDDKTANLIKAAILEKAVEQGWTDEEGQLPDLLAGPVSVMIEGVYQAMIAMIPKFWVDATSGIYIEYAANALGIYRKEGACATCTMTLVGTAGATISAGTLFLTADGLAFGLDYDVTLDSDGNGSGSATAQGVGSAYNIDEDELTKMYTNLSTLTSYSNSAATGGVDVETDAALFERLDDTRKSPSTSGNVADYKEWALSIAGVGYAKIVPLQNGAGTVGVILANDSGGEMDDDLCQEVADYIETVRPIGASVTVTSVEGVTIDIVVEADLSTSVTAVDVAEAFATNVTSYFAELADTWEDDQDSYTLVYNKILLQLISVDGVEDVTTLTINGYSSNLSMDSDQLPTLGEVSVNE